VRETNAGISSCSFDDGAARLQETLALGVLDDEEGGAVLDRTTGVLELGLSEDIAASLFGETLEADEGGFSDRCTETSVCNLQVHMSNTVPSRKPRCPMPWALEMLIAVCCAASIWLRLSAFRHAEAAKLRAAVLNIVALRKRRTSQHGKVGVLKIHDDAIRLVGESTRFRPMSQL
jgi:hypothetical protein